MADLPQHLIEAGARALADWLNLDYDRIGDGQKTLCHQAEAVLGAATDHLDPEGLLAEIADYAEQHAQQREELNRYRERLDSVVRQRNAQGTEIENLRKYAETTKYHQDQHAAAVRELEKFRADHTEVAAVEFEQMARDLRRRADNLPLTDEDQIQRLGDFREIADKLLARADELRCAR